MAFPPGFFYDYTSSPTSHLTGTPDVCNVGRKGTNRGDSSSTKLKKLRISSCHPYGIRGDRWDSRISYLHVTPKGFGRSMEFAYFLSSFHPAGLADIGGILIF